MGIIKGVLSTKEAAAILQVHQNNLLRVPGIKSVRRRRVGTAWAWNEEDVRSLAQNFVPGTGRPRQLNPARQKVDGRRRFNSEEIQAAHAAATALMLREYTRIVPGATEEGRAQVRDLFLQHYNYLIGALSEKEGGNNE